MVAARTNRLATGWMAKLHQDLWRTQLRFHFWWVSINFNTFYIEFLLKLKKRYSKDTQKKCQSMIALQNCKIKTWISSKETSKRKLKIHFKSVFEFISSDIHVIPISTRQFIYEIGQLRLRGDVIIRCYQITTNERTLHSAKTLNRELIFSTQFHTCAITERDITFYRSDLDYACDGESKDKNENFSNSMQYKHNLKLKSDFFFGSLLDPRIPIDHKVILHFGDNNLVTENRSLHFQSPLVKLEPLNSVAKYNSLERFDDGKYIRVF